MVTVKTLNCVYCNEFSEVKMTHEEFLNYTSHRRNRINELLPEWSAKKRELLITGSHFKCLEKIKKENNA